MRGRDGNSEEGGAKWQPRAAVLLVAAQRTTLVPASVVALGTQGNLADLLIVMSVSV